MFTDFIIDRMKKHVEQDAIIHNDEVYSYKCLVEKIEYWNNWVTNNIEAGKVVALLSDFNLDSIAILFCLIENKNIVAPIRNNSKNISTKIELAQAEYILEVGSEKFEITATGVLANHNLIIKLNNECKPGVIVFTSGSTDEPKAALHDFTLLLKKFEKEKASYRTISFLLFDHIGGLNTLFQIVSNAGVIGIPNNKTPNEICRFIQKYKIELLPITPTFLNILLYSHAYDKYDLSSLKIISYGTEPMAETTLRLSEKVFPKVVFKQLYGLTELGIVKSISKNSDSQWIKIGGDGCSAKIENNILFIKTESTILGYLNSEIIIDNDGWFNTGDLVETDGEWIKILGRESEMINVGGRKTFPAEIESVILEMENILDVTVSGIKNPVMGQVVKAKVNLKNEESVYELKKRVQKYCSNKLEPYKIPVHVEIANEKQYSDRFKRIRK